MKLPIRMAAGLSTVLLLALAGPAGAETASLADPAGDNRTPGYDLRHLDYANPGRSVIARVHVGDLRPRAVVHVEISAREAVNGYGAEVRKRAGRTTVSLVETDTGDRIPCPAMEATWRPLKGLVWLRVPARCLGLDMVVVKVKTSLRRAGGRLSDTSPARLVSRG